MSRDLYAERQADLAREELEALRELRQAVDAVGHLLRLSNAAGRPLDEQENRSICLAFDSDGCGPFTTVSPEQIWALIRLAAKAREVSP